MFRSIWEDIKREYSYGNMVTRLIIINGGVFVLVNLIWVILRLSNGRVTPAIYGDILHFFSISSDWWHNLTHPWVFITHMFLHEGFWHILANMLFLYWFGRILGDFIGDHRILPIYLLCGLAGGLAFFLAANTPIGPGSGHIHYALGASAAAIGIIVAAAVLSPDYLMHLPLIGGVKIKWIVAALVLIDLVGIAGNTNTGGHFGHLGGALFGGFYVLQLRQGRDWTVPVNNLLDRLRNLFQGLGGAASRRNRGPRVAYRNPSRKKTTVRKGGASSDNHHPLSHQEQLDAILDKIKQSGYESLSEEEKDFLFNASKK